MPSPAKPAKIDQNRPTEFKEALASPMAYMPTTPRLSNTQLRIGLYIIWAAATVTAGAGLGLLLTSNHNATTAAVNPVPIATANLTVASIPASSLRVQQSGVALNNLQITPDNSIYQAGAGTAQIAATTNQLQPSNVPVTLQPGYIGQNDIQGTIGTNPVN